MRSPSLREAERAQHREPLSGGQTKTRAQKINNVPAQQPAGSQHSPFVPVFVPVFLSLSVDVVELQVAGASDAKLSVLHGDGSSILLVYVLLCQKK